MKIYKNIDEFKGVDYPVVTVGTFDGVHIGHQKIIKRLTEEARKNNGETVLITFHPHPRLIIHSDSKNFKFINTQKRKFELLEKAGIDHLIIIPFTKEFSRQTSEEFIKNIVVDKVKTKKLVIGYNHHFGKNRLGDFRNLFDLGRKYGFKVEKIPVQDVKNIAISSTKIRKALNEGKIRKANELLGYDYSITGKVVHGSRIGHTIGFPTANIDVENEYKLIAANGVYACRIEWNGQLFKGMGNIGFRPTIDHGDLTIEVHIFDFDKDIYGDPITIFFIDRIRDERKFKDLDALRLQLFKDKEIVLEILN